jgi:hypothetical protein
LSAKVIANFCGYRVPRGQRDGSLRPYSRFSRQEPLLFYQVAPQFVLTRLSGTRSRPTTSFSLVVPGIEPGPPVLYPRPLTTRPQRRSKYIIHFNLFAFVDYNPYFIRRRDQTSIWLMVEKIVHNINYTVQNKYLFQAFSISADN